MSVKILMSGLMSARNPLNTRLLTLLTTLILGMGTLGKATPCATTAGEERHNEEQEGQGDKEGEGVTDRQDREREHQEQEKADRVRREEREKRADELREGWRRRHPSGPDEDKIRPRKEPPG